MSPVIENLIISVTTGLVASATMLEAAASSAPRDWVVIIATGVAAFGGCFINGLRQLQKDPSK